MNFKPLRDIAEQNIVNGIYTYDQATGSQGTPVVISVAWSGDVARFHGNLAPSFTNITSKRFELKARVRPANSGERPFGVLLYDVREANQFGYSLIWDKQRKDELQCVVSGEAVPILRKGNIMVGPFAGTTPERTVNINKFAVVSNAGDRWAWMPGLTGGALTGDQLAAKRVSFAEAIGAPDADGYAYVHIDCYA